MSDAALFTLHEGLPRQGPGSTAATERALARLRPHLPRHPKVADLGCGAGPAALVLARVLDGPVVAIDIHAPFLAQLRAAADAAGLGERIETRPGDMAEPPIEPGSLDLIWSEGAIYILGFEAGLRRWRPLLKPGGLMALTELSWLGDARPDELVAYWAEAYPGIGSIDDNRARAERTGYTVLGTDPLPPSAWWDEYYTPLLARCDALETGADPDLAAVIAETRREIALFERYAEHYGYVFYLLRA